MVEVEHTSVLQQGPWTEHHCMDITSYHLFSLPLPPSHHVWTARLHQESAIWFWKIWFVVGAEKAQCEPHRSTIPDEECCEVITVCTVPQYAQCSAFGWCSSNEEVAELVGKVDGQFMAALWLHQSGIGGWSPWGLRRPKQMCGWDFFLFVVFKIWSPWRMCELFANFLQLMVQGEFVRIV